MTDNEIQHKVVWEKRNWLDKWDQGLEDPHIEEEDYLKNKGKNELYSFNLLITFKALLCLNENIISPYMSKYFTCNM